MYSFDVAMELGLRIAPVEPAKLLVVMPHISWDSDTVARIAKRLVSADRSIIPLIECINAVSLIILM
jgi:hypothetical protein